MNHKITSSILGTLSLSDAFVAVCTAGKLSSNIYSTNSQSSLLSSHTSKNQQKHSFVFEYGSSLVELLNPQPGEIILDVGCGSGQLTSQIEERGAQAIGFDADPNMVERAQKEYPTVDFFQSDVATLEMPGTQVDAVFSNAALHWVKKAEPAVAAMARVLRPGGRFVVEFGGKGNVDRIVKASNQVLGKDDQDSPWYFPSIADYSTLLEKHGIEVLSANLYDRPTVLEEGDDGMANWLRMFGGILLQDVSMETKEQVIQDIVVELRKESNSMYDGEKWTADYRRLRILGKKLN